MKELNFDGIKEMLKKEQMLKISGGYTGGGNEYSCSCSGGGGALYYGANCADVIDQKPHEYPCDFFSCVNTSNASDACYRS